MLADDEDIAAVNDVRRGRNKCKGRTPGNVLTSYACSRYARAGSDWCYWHDPATEAERMERTRKAAQDRKLEKEDREKRLLLARRR